MCLLGKVYWVGFGESGLLCGSASLGLLGGGGLLVAIYWLEFAGAYGLRMHNLVPKLFGHCYDSGIASLSLCPSSFMGICRLVLVIIFHIKIII